MKKILRAGQGEYFDFRCVEFEMLEEHPSCNF